MPSSAAPTAPRVEHRTDRGAVLGLGTATPRLSWTIPDADADWRQSRYAVEVARAGDVRSFVVDSADQVLVRWPAEPLASRERAEIRVRVAHGDDWSGWSPTTTVEAGLLDPADWTARLVSPAQIGRIDDPAPVLTGAIDVPGPVASARLYATAHGIYQATINGRRIDDTVLAPGWTAYEHRLRYHAFDVTELVRPGVNELEVLLGNGWYRGYLSYLGERALYGDRLALLAQLEVTTDDGTVHVLATDRSWVARESEVVEDDLYNGQTTDLRRRGVAFPTSGVEVLPTDLSVLVAPEGPPIRPTGLLPAQRVWASPSGRTLVDFGQNAVGWVRLRTRGLPAGTEVVVRHAEVLEHEELATRPLRAAKATDTYVVAGGDEVLEPSLTLHGFRYAEVSGVPDLRPEDVELVVVGSDLERTGWFSCSDDRLDRLHENVVWSTRGNFVDLPTDCPQRDERLGWTGDIQVFGPTAAFLFDTAGLLGSWLADLAVEQFPDGSVPHVVPNVNRTGDPDPAAAAWGDAAVIVPWTLYQRTGDLGVLDRQLPSMQAWVDKEAVLAGADRLWTGGFQFGDWLDPDAPPENPGAAKADRDVVATAHLARSASILAEAAAVLGRAELVSRYAALAEEVRDAFARTYVTPAGRVLSDAQTVYALALEWDLLPTPEQRAEAGNRLADLVRRSGFRISTGFVGTPLVCDALTRARHVDVAYRLLLQTECPSWLYPVTMGATTIWERWDSMLPDGSINPGEMTSFNHYALGAVADWLHRSVAGLAPAEPGYRRLLVEPQPTADLTHAEARHVTPYGEASVSWDRAEGHLWLRVRVPVGAEAEVRLPGAAGVVVVGHGEHHWEMPDPVGDGATRLDWSRATVRELLDDAVTWRQVVDAAVRTGIAPGGEAQAAGMLADYLDAPARLVARALAPEQRTDAAQALGREIDAIAELGSARLAGV
jgi:alpha-L-rhamnosidase